MTVPEFKPGDGVFVTNASGLDKEYEGRFGWFEKIAKTGTGGFARVALYMPTLPGERESVLLHPESIAALADYEVIGYDNPYVVQWDATGDTTGTPGPYVSGETPDEYGTDNLSETERARLLAAGWEPNH